MIYTNTFKSLKLLGEKKNIYVINKICVMPCCMVCPTKYTGKFMALQI